MALGTQRSPPCSWGWRRAHLSDLPPAASSSPRSTDTTPKPYFVATYLMRGGPRESLQVLKATSSSCNHARILPQLHTPLGSRLQHPASARHAPCPPGAGAARVHPLAQRRDRPQPRGIPPAALLLSPCGRLAEAGDLPRSSLNKPPVTKPYSKGRGGGAL